MSHLTSCSSNHLLTMEYSAKPELYFKEEDIKQEVNECDGCSGVLKEKQLPVKQEHNVRDEEVDFEVKSEEGRVGISEAIKPEQCECGVKQEPAGKEEPEGTESHEVFPAETQIIQTRTCISCSYIVTTHRPSAMIMKEVDLTHSKELSKIHSNLSPFQCQSCIKNLNKSFTRNLQKSSGPGEILSFKWQCTVPTCGKRFESAHCLKVHALTHDIVPVKKGLNKVRRIVAKDTCNCRSGYCIGGAHCSICKRSSRQMVRTSLKTKSKRFVCALCCGLCQKSFSCKAQLVDHYELNCVKIVPVPRSLQLPGI